MRKKDHNRAGTLPVADPHSLVTIRPALSHMHTSLAFAEPWQGFPDYFPLKAARGGVGPQWAGCPLRSGLTLSRPWQGFPDYVALAARGAVGAQGWVRNKSVVERYQQMSNAVSPLVAAALGRCLVLAAEGRAMGGAAVVPVPDPELAEARSSLCADSPRQAATTHMMALRARFTAPASRTSVHIRQLGARHDLIWRLRSCAEVSTRCDCAKAHVTALHSHAGVFE